MQPYQTTPMHTRTYAYITVVANKQVNTLAERAGFCLASVIVCIRTALEAGMLGLF